MSDPVRVLRPVETLIRAVAGGTDPAERDQRASTFARGLVLGALVGAAIAGSTIWQRRSGRPIRQPRIDPPAPAPETPTESAPPEG